MKKLNLPLFDFDIQMQGQKKHILDIFRKKFVTLTPEEWVRQHWLRFLVQYKGVPAGLIAVETPVLFNGMTKRADIVVYGKNHKPQLIVECKAPQIPINAHVCWQIAMYNFTLKAPYLIVSNGMQHFVFECKLNTKEIKPLENLPSFVEWT